jgi:hypothetical protein
LGNLLKIPSSTPAPKGIVEATVARLKASLIRIANFSAAEPA